MSSVFEDVGSERRNERGTDFRCPLKYYCRKFQAGLFVKNLFSAAFIAAAAVLLSGCTSGSKYVIEGSGDQLVDGHWMYVSDGVDWSMLDSALIENGAFRIEGTDMGSGVAMLYMIWGPIPRLLDCIR